MVSTDSKPVISVIVPVYNCEKYLAKCVESIIGQTFSDWELLLIDDGSKDNSPQICNKFVASDNRIRAIHKINGCNCMTRTSQQECRGILELRRTLSEKCRFFGRCSFLYCESYGR